MRLTSAQRAALKRAIANGGSIVIGGIDCDPVRMDVAVRLYLQGMLRCAAGDLTGGQIWTITEAGRAVITKLDEHR